MQHAIIVFTKVPKAGRVKTRLTEERGGILTPQEAMTLYEACLMDVLDICTSIDNAHIWICHDLEGDRDYLNSIIARLAHPAKLAGVFHDQGGSFDECMQYAADFILKPGKEQRLADSILILGGDVCGLQVHTLLDAIDKLEMLGSNAGRMALISEGSHVNALGAGIVVSPDQEGGFNLAGYTANTPFDFRTVFYNMQGITALEVLAEKARTEQIPLIPLEIVFDIDLPVDLASLIPVLNVLEQGTLFDWRVQAPRRTIAVLKEMGLQACAEPIEGWAV